MGKKKYNMNVESPQGKRRDDGGKVADAPSPLQVREKEVIEERRQALGEAIKEAREFPRKRLAKHGGRASPSKGAGGEGGGDGEKRGRSKRGAAPSTGLKNEILSLVQMYQRHWRPELPGMTMVDMRNMFNAAESPLNRRVGAGWGEEICDDMFRLLDSDHDGFVTLRDMVKHFFKNVKNLPAINLKKRQAQDDDLIQRTASDLDKQLTPRFPEEHDQTLRDVFSLWTADSTIDGQLTRDELIRVLAGRKGAGFNWVDAREAAEHMFEALPAGSDAIGFADFANHVQDVIVAPYNELMVGRVRKFKTRHSGRPEVPRSAVSNGSGPRTAVRQAQKMGASQKSVQLPPLNDGSVGFFRVSSGDSSKGRREGRRAASPLATRLGSKGVGEGAIDAIDGLDEAAKPAGKKELPRIKGRNQQDETPYMTQMGDDAARELVPRIANSSILLVRA